MHIGAVLLLLVSPALLKAEETNMNMFDGFPPIGIESKRQRSTSVIASDPVKGLLRPKWCRPMADFGSSVTMFRFKGAIYFAHGAGDGHRGTKPGEEDKRFIYVSKDEGKTWTSTPQPRGARFGKYLRCLNGKLYDFWFEGENEKGFTWVQTSGDGVKFSRKRKVYKPQYWLYEVIYDQESKMFWCAAQSTVSGKGADGQPIPRDVHLIRSSNCLDWKHVSTLPAVNVNVSEAAMRFEPDRTIVVVVRRKWTDDFCSLAIAKPPYKQWEEANQRQVAEGHSFFECGGQTFMGSRAYYRGQIPELKESKTLRYVSKDGVAYTVIHKFTKDRKLVPWAVVDSMGDCSYPRFVETPTEVLVAYYSEHEDNICKPYLAAFDKAAFLRGK